MIGLAVCKKQDLGSDIKHNSLHLRFGTNPEDCNYNAVAAGKVTESNPPNASVERSKSSDSSTVYNEPFSEDAYSLCVPPKLKHAVSRENMTIGNNKRTLNNKQLVEQSSKLIQ